MTVKGPRRFSVQRVDVERRRRFVLDLVANGATYQQAADAVLAEGLAPRITKRADGSSEPRYRKQDALKDCEIAMRRITEEPAARLKAIQLRQLQQAKRQMMLDVSNSPDPADRARSVTALVALMNREAKLRGLDEPVRTELEITAHLDQTAAVVFGAMMAAAPGAGLSDEQRALLITGMRAHLADTVPERPALLAPVIDLQPVDDTG